MLLPHRVDYTRITAVNVSMAPTNLKKRRLLYYRDLPRHLHPDSEAKIDVAM